MSPINSTIGSRLTADPARRRIRAAATDLRTALSMHELWLFLGWRDTRKHYSRSILGPLWVTLSMGVIVFGLGLLYSQIFGQELKDYLPFLAAGFIIWGLIGGLITGSCDVFSGSAASIRQIAMPFGVYILQFVWRQFVIFLHNFVIFVAVALIFGVWPGWVGLLFFPALALIVLNGVFVSMILGPLCARFRDIPMIVASVMQMAFFLSPIIWSPEQVPERVLLLGANPFYHFIEIAREPLLGGTGSLLNWVVCAVLTAANGVFSFLFFGRFRARIAYWA